LLKYHGKPESNNKELNEIGGAFINCWVESKNIDQADRIARKEIDKLNWDILNHEESYEITRKDYMENKVGLQYYEQALIDKFVCVFHTYPID